jgi:hypothetical protein
MALAKAPESIEMPDNRFIILPPNPVPIDFEAKSRFSSDTRKRHWAAPQD